ncbi:3-hydroxyacyl-CoA dehydrogenase family protein [Metabacillus litoralis]|uniref:3-hydroxyacyl-CoA dehydrogenase family protein n=1 Tax=Metabacillus litoralis TaxID=152268 RepID=UPI000EF60F52|nr:3-hydroxyacyl-CoA dehydrogenase NAD-binding domain-containing protein [Metabacillus litoralis]MCM3163513.1 3-hydroxyacyl-CoA dehydrogenase NAD-binding domain-containing protein [Metabacillus litoralis]
MNTNFRKVAICGSGLMGTGIAQVFANYGVAVAIYSVEDTEAEVIKKVDSDLRMLVDRESFSIEKAQDTLARIQVSNDLEKTIEDADLVVECIPEKMNLKQTLFERLDRICDPHVILATNTSVMSITEIAKKAKLKNRILGTHFWNPAFLIPLVEVVRTEDTSEEVIGRTINILNAVGKHPIRVNKDVPGFVANRLQHALWREAISIVENGIADAITVDESIKYSFGMRLPVLGPIENADMVGTNLTLAIHHYLLKHLENSTEPSPLLVEMVEKGELGFKSGMGFRQWSKEEMIESRRKLNHYLIDVEKRNHNKPIKNN